MNTHPDDHGYDPMEAALRDEKFGMLVQRDEDMYASTDEWIEKRIAQERDGAEVEKKRAWQEGFKEGYKQAFADGYAFCEKIMKEKGKE